MKQGKVVEVAGNVKSLELSAVIFRCGCGDPDAHAGEVCPMAWIEDHGVVARYKKPNRLTAFFKRILGGGK